VVHFRSGGRAKRTLIKLLPYDFRLFYRKGTLNPADGPSRRPDYLANNEEIDSTPASRLLPVLRDRQDQKEETKTRLESIQKVESTDKFNDRAQVSATTTDASTFPVTVTDIDVNEIKRFNVHNKSMTPNVGQSLDASVLPSDEIAKRNLETLHAQVLTKASAQEVLTGVRQGEALTDDILQRISKVQELDPFCTRIARLQLHPRPQHTHLQPFTGPVVDKSQEARAVINCCVFRDVSLYLSKLLFELNYSVFSTTARPQVTGARHVQKSCCSGHFGGRSWEKM